MAQVAKNLGISESCLRRWMEPDEIDAGRAEGLTSAEKRELVELRRKNRVLETEVEILKRAQRLLRAGERAPKIGFRLVLELAADGVPVAVACRVLKVSRAGYYEWRGRPARRRVRSPTTQLVATISAGPPRLARHLRVPRVHAELRLGWAWCAGASGSPG